MRKMRLRWRRKKVKGKKTKKKEKNTGRKLSRKKKIHDDGTFIRIEEGTYEEKDAKK